MLDVEIFGVRPGAHHLVNIGFHSINALLLLSVLCVLTGSLWRSAAVAALFALHPLHVEPVAWISQRRELLSTTFFLLVLALYNSYARTRVRTTFGLLVVVYALGLMAKPMLMTTPLLLLLLDAWPLDRMRVGSGPRRDAIVSLVREKLPLFLLAVTAALVALYAQHQAGALVSQASLPTELRVFNAALSAGKYLMKTVWPFDLAVFYPYPAGPFSNTGALLSLAALAAISILVAFLRLRYPFAAVGWCWFLLSLLPVIGFVQIGSQALADRYTYLPLTGLFIAASWSLPSAKTRRGTASFLLPLFGILGCGLLGAASFSQVRYWRESRTLFSHALEVTRDNALAENNLAAALSDEGNLKQAIIHYRQALQIVPAFAQAHSGLGAALALQGNSDEALEHLRLACQLEPDRAESHLNLAKLFAERGSHDAALRHFRIAVSLAPESPEGHFNLGTFLAARGRYAEAQASLSEAVRRNPDDAGAHNNLAYVLSQLARREEAIVHYREALRLNPGHPRAGKSLNDLLQGVLASQEQRR